MSKNTSKLLSAFVFLLCMITTINANWLGIDKLVTTSMQKTNIDFDVVDDDYCTATTDQIVNITIKVVHKGIGYVQNDTVIWYVDEQRVTPQSKYHLQLQSDQPTNYTVKAVARVMVLVDGHIYSSHFAEHYLIVEFV